MKCPACQFVCSDKHDICTKCLIDLRPHKKNLGLEISDAKSSHAEILERIKNSSAATRRKNKPKKIKEKSVGESWLKKLFFGKKKPQAEAKSVPKPKEIELQEKVTPSSEVQNKPSANAAAPVSKPTASTQLGNSLTSKSPIVREERAYALQLLESDENISQILDQIIQDTYVSVETQRTQKMPVPDIITFTEKIESPQIIEESVAETVLETASTTGLQEIQVSEPKAPIAIVFKPAIEVDPPSLPPSLKLRGTGKLRGTSLTGLTPIFDSAWRDLTDVEQDDFEISFEQLESVDSREDLTVLFDLAQESLESPERAQVYVEPASEKREVRADKAERVLKSLEVNLNAAQLSLKSDAHRPHTHSVERLASLKEVVKASRTERLRCAVIDVLMTALLSVGFVALNVWLWDSELSARLIERTLDTIDLVLLAAFLLCSFMAHLVIYPLLCFLILQDTLGTKILRLRLTTTTGRNPQLSNLVVRSLSCPLSNLCFGYLPLLFGSQPLHDILARTQMVKR